VAVVPAPDHATSLPYRIVLRSRNGEVFPQRNKDGQTAGGNIDVVQTRPDQVTIWMRGAAVAGAEQWKGGKASMHFELHQEFEVVPARPGLRPPRLSLEGRLVGTLQSTLKKEGGTAGQGPACASINCEGEPVLQLCLQGHGVKKGQRLFVNDEEGPFEMVVLPGHYCLDQTFDLSAEQPYHPCQRLGAGAGAFFDPAPRLEARWNYLLTPFGAVPSRDFGFAAVVRVSEDLPPEELSAAGPAPGKGAGNSAIPTTGTMIFQDREPAQPQKKTWARTQ
jgi:hypothetical protein